MKYRGYLRIILRRSRELCGLSTTNMFFSSVPKLLSDILDTAVSNVKFSIDVQEDSSTDDEVNIIIS